MTSFEQSNSKAKGNKRQPFIQAKLTIGQPNDQYEQEADRMAEQVMRMPEGEAPVQRMCEDCEEPAVAKAMADGESLQMKPLAEGISSFVQMQHNGGDGDTEKKGINNIEKALQILEDKKLSPEEKLILLKDMNFELEELPRFIHDPSLLLPLKKLEDEELPIGPFFDELHEETKPDDEEPRVIAHNEEEEVLQAKKENEGATEPSFSLESRLNSRRGYGKELPESTLESMNRAFGTDFSGVKVHTDNEAVQMNRELGAKAFTHGSDVYFNEGEYNPGGREGKKLLGHELTHVVQQNYGAGGTGKAIQADWGDYFLETARGAFNGHPADHLGIAYPISKIFSQVVASNTIGATAVSIPSDWKEKVISYMAHDLSDGLILSTAMARLPRFYQGGWIMDLNKDAGAMTLNTAIFFPHSLSLSTYVHELVHVFQYGVLGVTGFLTSFFGMSAATIAYRWASGQPTNHMRSSPHEDSAYNLEDRFNTWHKSIYGTDPERITI